MTSCSALPKIALPGIFALNYSTHTFCSQLTRRREHRDGPARVPSAAPGVNLSPSTCDRRRSVSSFVTMTASGDQATRQVLIEGLSPATI